MAVIRFPDPRRASPHGIVAVGGDLEPETLLAAYRQGIFPWPVEGLPLPWFCPRRRAILEFDDLHVSRSLAKTRRKKPFRLTIDSAFRSVVELCSETPRPDQDGTWISAEIIEAYDLLHKLGHAHSVEAWEGDELVGGVYGVDPGGAFGGESMFYLRPNASKLALLHLIDHLRERGLTWLDVQVMTPHMKALGAKNITRDDFLMRLATELATGRKLF